MSLMSPKGSSIWVEDCEGEQEAESGVTEQLNAEGLIMMGESSVRQMSPALESLRVR